MTDYDKQFNLRARHPLGRVHLLANALESHLARLTLRKSLDISYGESEGEKLDIFPAANPNAPVLVFIHGGYFRTLDKRQYNYLARPFVKAGFTVVMFNYDLAPKVKVSEIVEQNLKAFRWVSEHIQQWNGNPNHILLCGHSVGAFLVAKILENEWDPIVRQSIAGAILLSGIFDLTNMKASYLNKSVRLTDQDVQGLSPMFGKVANFPQTLIAVGENETDEFVEQSRAYAEKLSEANQLTKCQVLKGKNHYTVSRLLSKRNNDLVEQILHLGRIG